MSIKLERRYRSLILGLGLVVLGITTLFLTQQPTAAINLSTVYLNSPVVSEGDDFATQVLGMPWDMTSDPYPDFGTVMGDISRSGFSVSNGMWNIKPTSYNPTIWLHWTSKDATQEILQFGDRYPIDPDKYSLISFRMCSNAAGQAQIWWFEDIIPHEAYGASDYIPILSGCHVYSMDLTQSRNYSPAGKEWEDTPIVRGLQLHPMNSEGNIDLQLDWVRLTTADTNNTVPISWSIAGAGGNQLYFYVSPTSCTSGGTMIGKAPFSSSGTFTWGNDLTSTHDYYPWVVYPIPESFEPGQYSVYMLIDNQGEPFCAESNLDVQKAPLLTFLSPSMSSGPDFSNEKLNNAWDMNDSVDISEIAGINGGFDHSCYIGTNTNDDPRIYLNTATNINTDEYRYLTYRIRMSGAQNDGWTSRLYWLYPAGDSRKGLPYGIQVFEGWHTYTVDLKDVLMRDDSTANWEDAPSSFRIDPHEDIQATEFELDFVKLTGSESVFKGDSYTIQYDYSAGPNKVVTLYYDTDTNPDNGRTQMDVSPQSASASTTESSESWSWDTSNVPIGTYYASASIQDGGMETNWYSEAPVRVINGGREISLGKTVVDEGDDFATQVLGLPWDMNEPPYPGPTTVFKRDVSLGSIKTEDSKWKFTTSGQNPLVWMHWTGIVDTQSVLKLGDSYPIDAEKYKLISMRLCSDRDEKALIYWFYNRAPHYPENPAKTGVSGFFDIKKGCHIYTMDMSTFPKIQGNWSGKPLGLRFNPAKLSNKGVNMELDWFRITTIDNQKTVPIDWSSMTKGSTLYFYASQTGCGVDGTKIGTQTVSQSSGTFSWGASLQNNESGAPYPIPESFEPGFYYIYALENDGGDPLCTSEKLEIRATPVVTFHSPSKYSGPDYATEELGDPWGMSNEEDIVRTNDIKTYKIENGLLTATSSGYKNWLELNVGKPIDTRKYKYLTYRMKMDGWQEIVTGWVARQYWWDIGMGTDPAATEAQIVFEGWQTYSIDMTVAPMLDTNPRDWDGYPTGIRFDPNEMPTPMTFSIDYFKLTGDNIITSGDTFEIRYEVSNEPNTSIAFYYDTDKNPGNGRSQIESFTQKGPYFVYLPSLFTSSTATTAEEIPLESSAGTLWNTTGVPAGSYYIAAEVSNGVSTTTWYSELPVIIEK